MALSNSTSNFTCEQINLESVYRSVFQCQQSSSLMLWQDPADPEYVRVPIGQAFVDSDQINVTQGIPAMVQDYEELLFNCSLELASQCPDRFCMEIVGRGNPELAGIGVFISYVLQVLASFVFVVLPFSHAASVSYRRHTSPPGASENIRGKETESETDFLAGYLESPFGFGLHRLVMESQIYFTLSIGIALAVEFGSHPFHSIYEHQVFPPVMAMTTASACMSTFWSIVHWRSHRFKRRPLIIAAIIAMTTIALGVIHIAVAYGAKGSILYHHELQQPFKTGGFESSDEKYIILRKPSLESSEMRAGIRIKVVQACTRIGFMDSMSETTRSIFVPFREDMVHTYSLLILQALAATILTAFAGAVPPRKNGEARIYCVLLVFALVLLQFSVSLLSLIKVVATRQAMRELQGDQFVEDTWDFDQILAVLAWSPLCTEFVYWVLYGNSRGLGPRRMFEESNGLIGRVMKRRRVEGFVRWFALSMRRPEAKEFLGHITSSSKNGQL